MTNHRTIRSILASFLLALFALGITPKIAIHALSAHHTDTHLSLDYGKSDQFNKAGFHCSTDNLVVEFPFLDHSLHCQLEPPPAFPAHRPGRLTEPIAEAHPIFGLRGPPAFSPAC